MATLTAGTSPSGLVPSSSSSQPPLYHHGGDAGHHVEHIVRIINQLIQPLTYDQRLQDIPTTADDDNDNEYSLVCSMTVGHAYEQLTKLERSYGRDTFHPSLWSIPQLILPGGDGMMAMPRDLSVDEQMAMRVAEHKRGPAGSPGRHSLRNTTSGGTSPWLPLSPTSAATASSSTLPLTSSIVPSPSNSMIPLTIRTSLSDRASFATMASIAEHREHLRSVAWYQSRELTDLFQRHIYNFPHVIMGHGGEHKRSHHDHDDVVSLDASVLIERSQPNDWDHAVRRCTNHRSRHPTLETIHDTARVLPRDLVRMIVDYTIPLVAVGRYYERRKDWHGAFTAYQLSMYYEAHPFATFKCACCYIYSMGTVKVEWTRAAYILRYGTSTTRGCVVLRVASERHDDMTIVFHLCIKIGIYLGSDECMYLLAVCHSASHGLPPNEHEAVALIKCSRDPMAFYAAAYRLVDPKHQRDEKLHSVLQGSRSLANVLAAIDYKHAYHRAFHRYSQCSRSLFSLGLYYDFGLILTKIQPRLSMKLYHMAAEQGHCKAQYHLGMSYRDGWPASTPDGPYDDIVDAEKGNYWFNLGYNQSGCVRAMLAIAVSKENYYQTMYTNRTAGDHRTARDIIPREDRDHIWNLTIRSYEGGLAMAARNIGGWYCDCGSQATARRHGIIYDMDDAPPGAAYIEAHRWYQRSMDLGGGTNPEAQQVTVQQMKWLERMLSQNYPHIYQQIMASKHTPPSGATTTTPTMTTNPVTVTNDGEGAGGGGGTMTNVDGVIHYLDPAVAVAVADADAIGFDDHDHDGDELLDGSLYDRYNDNHNDDNEEVDDQQDDEDME